MQEEFFMNSMEKDPKLSGEHGAQTRKSLALKAEEILGLDLETVVADDDLMYDSLMKLKPLENPKKNPMHIYCSDGHCHRSPVSVFRLTASPAGTAVPASYDPQTVRNISQHTG